MTTVVNNPQPSGDSGMGFLLGIIVLIAFVSFVVWRWGLPAMRSAQETGVQINVPESIDVNVNKTE